MILKKCFASQKGAAYVSILIVMLLMMGIFGLILNSFQIIGIKDEADRIADALLETATFYGGFGSEFDAQVVQLRAEYFDFTVTYDAQWFNEAYKRVQLGDTLSLTVTFSVSLKGMGIDTSIPITVVRTGASEKYWK